MFHNEIWQDWPHWSNRVLLLQCECEHPTSNLRCLLSQHFFLDEKKQRSSTEVPGLGVQLGWWRDVNPHTLEVGEGYHWLFIYIYIVRLRLAWTTECLILKEGRIEREIREKETEIAFWFFFLFWLSKSSSLPSRTTTKSYFYSPVQTQAFFYSAPNY